MRGFPFQDEIFDFVASHSKVFVVEQNRDAQLKTLLVNDAGINPASLISILHYDGTPITARFIQKEIAEIVSALNVPPDQEGQSRLNRRPRESGDPVSLTCPAGTGGAILGAERPAEQEALHFVAAVRAQEGELLLRLDAFGDDHQARGCVRHGDDGVGDRRVVRVVRQVARRTSGRSSACRSGSA